jgi:hypothetical protein
LASPTVAGPTTVGGTALRMAGYPVRVRIGVLSGIVFALLSSGLASASVAHSIRPVGHSPGRDQPPRSKVPTTEERAAPEGVVGDLPGPGPPERLLPGSVRPRPRGRRAQHRARPGHRQYLGRESHAAPTATAMLFTFSTVALAWASLAILLRTPSQPRRPPATRNVRPGHGRTLPDGRRSSGLLRPRYARPACPEGPNAGAGQISPRRDWHDDRSVRLNKERGMARSGLGHPGPRFRALAIESNLVGAGRARAARGAARGQ